MQTTIPAGPNRRRPPSDGRGDPELDKCLHGAFDAMEEAAGACGVPLSASSSPRADPARPLARSDLVARGHAQTGTLGSGNHFIEVLADPEDQVWVLVHSGSRGFGGSICANFHRMALAHCAETGVALPDPGLAWLPAHGTDGSDDRWGRAGRCYAQAMAAALDYAETNRRHMLDTAAAIFERRFPTPSTGTGRSTSTTTTPPAKSTSPRPCGCTAKGR